MKLLKFAGLLILLTASVRGFAQANPEGDITVRVLTLAHLHQLQLIPFNHAATFRTCAVCTAHSATDAVNLTATGTKISLAGKGSPSKTTEVFADGSFRLQAPQQPPLLVVGKLHVTSSANQLLVRLTLPMERYVVGVLNGETAPDEPLESLKAMAIVTRTYATMNRARHQAEGFDVCDDTHCQVVRFTAARPLVEQAVSETAGETLWYQRARAHVFFHQHCGGMTADVRDVWQSEGVPAQVPYLRAHRDIYCVVKSSAEWESEVRLHDLQDALSRSGIQADLAAENLTIAARTETGRVHTLSIGTLAIPANTFRLAVNRTLGWSTIKSDWYELERRGDSLVFHGRGSGHGVGLCQIGAAEMAREGNDAASILAEYFPGTNVGVTANDRGWTTRDAGAFSVSATDERDLQRALPLAAAAWQRAHAQFPSATAPHVTVRIFPSVELFRQSTNQPGWVAASTQASIISVEPYQVLAQKQLFAPVLEHEFLHTLVEANCAPAAPLWLREGLVEALSSKPLRASSAAWTIERLEQQLRAPASQDASAE
ncbi:MAG TPA: SpoIID/LytB domain-containing protein, partial [Acidobacteriaceae bacterium]|nr:SpoIID/LytB domain-containing protein [Acidobacteriaceae bacterium]